MKALRRAALASMVALGCASNGKGKDVVATSAAGLDPAQVVAMYIERSFEEHPDVARGAGLHDYDGRVEEVSKAAVERRLARAKVYVETVNAIDPASVEDPVRLDLELTRLDALQTIFGIEQTEEHRKVLSYAGLFDTSGYLSRDYAPLEVRVGKLLDHAAAATVRVDDVLAILDPKQPRTHLATAKGMLGGYRSFYEGDVATQSKPALDAEPALAKRFAEVVPALLAAVDRLIAWIDAHEAEATDDFALGEAKFLEMLRVNEDLEITLPELQRMADANYRANYDAYVATAKRIDPNKSVQEVAAMVAAERLPADQVITTAAQQLDTLREYIEANDIITIGSDERATVKVTPPFLRFNSAFLDMAGPFEKAKGSFYYISPPDPSWPKATQEAYIPWAGDLLGTSIHEVYPGHFVHGLQFRRAPTKAQKIYGSYAFIEGWAHYTEQMMLDAGYGDDDPRLRLGQLSNALLRNCRFLAALGLHTQGMTVEAAETMFQEKCFVDPGNARQQAFRGTFDPGYLSYTLGKLAILDLREKFFAAKKTKSLRAFHDWLLSYGGAPVALIAKRM
ncbi:MAG: DUF885 domain-containing protein [Deltaproteobacteria bacterium]